MQKWKPKKMNLHVVVAVEGFAANGAGELGRADEDLGRSGDPVLGRREARSLGGGRADVESDGDATFRARVLEVLVWLVPGRVGLARRAEGEEGGAIFVFVEAVIGV